MGKQLLSLLPLFHSSWPEALLYLSEGLPCRPDDLLCQPENFQRRPMDLLCQQENLVSTKDPLSARRSPRSTIEPLVLVRDFPVWFRRLPQRPFWDRQGPDVLLCRPKGPLCQACDLLCLPEALVYQPEGLLIPSDELLCQSKASLISRTERQFISRGVDFAVHIAKEK